MYRQFLRDPFFLLKYNVVNILVLSLASVVLLRTWSSIGESLHSWLLLLCVLPMALPNFWTISFSALSLVAVSLYFGMFTMNLADLWLVPVGALVGLQSAFLMHNAAHGNVRPGWLNRLVGELCGLHQLMGFPGWTVPHIKHHQSPDDPDKDPHPPGHMSFARYLDQMFVQMARAARNTFFEQWGERKDVGRIWAAISYAGMLARYSRTVFLLLLLGTKVFVLGYVVSKLVNMVWYVHFNYATHRPKADGSVEILDLDHNWYYKAINAFMPGVYYHKSHHARASLFDPRKLDMPQEQPLISYRHPELSS